MQTVLRWFRDRRANQITPQDIERKLAELSEQGRKPATLNRYHTLLSLIYSLAVRSEKPPENRAEREFQSGMIPNNKRISPCLTGYMLCDSSPGINFIVNSGLSTKSMIKTLTRQEIHANRYDELGHMWSEPLF